MNETYYDLHKPKLLNLKEKTTTFFSSLSGSDMSVNDLRTLKTNFLDDPFMRVD